MELNHCPHCEGRLRSVAKKCDDCGLELRAEFQDNPLVTLAREEQDFLLEFILTAGNFKALGERLDLTYPTLRSRLDRILVKLETHRNNESPTALLDAVDRGTIKPDDAIAQLKRMTRK